jgi:arylsulfatase
LGYSDLGCYGGEIQTPQLDRLAERGLRFTQFYNTARCWPSRAALLTGYYAQQVNRDPQGQRPAWAALLPELLREAGYHSYHSGKWHVDGPVLAGGFERSYNLTDQDRYFSPKKHELDDQALAPPQPGETYYATTAVADRAIEWLDQHEQQHRESPFLLYVAFISPHFPLQAPAEDIARYRDRYLAGWEVVRRERHERMASLGIYHGELAPPEPTVTPSWNLAEAELQKEIGPGEVGYAIAWDRLTPEQQRFQATKMAIHAAMVDRMDREIGRVLDRVRAMGAEENTLVMFASDNGATAEQIIRGDRHAPGAVPGSAESYLGLGPGWSTVANTPFRRHKSWTHEGGIATPLVVSWPAGIASHGALRHTPSHLIDVVPTLLELAGIAPPSAWRGEARPALPGRSLVPCFAGDATIERDALFFKHQGNRGLRVGDWKIVASGDDSPWELYNLATDRVEVHNLAEKDPARVEKLAAMWTQRDAEYARQGATGKPLGKPGKAAAKAGKSQSAAPKQKRGP